MDELVYLKDLLIILGFAVIVVSIFHRFKLPAIAGFILSGLIAGPQGIQLIKDSHHIEVMAEIGVALLLFSIGLELSLKKLKRLWRLALIGGFLQVSISSIIVYSICYTAGLSKSSSIIVGFIMALSSTAIVLRGLHLRGEIDAPHGRLILGILVFQDFCVVPIMLLIPLLEGTEISSAIFALTLAKSIGIVIIILLLAIFVSPKILKIVAKTRQRQLFILTVFVLCLGTAFLVTASGASLAIGAFLAGLVVSGSEYRHQALADMISIREIFASLFFVSVGMLLSPSMILSNVIPILIILTGILLGKSIIVFITALIMKMPLRASIISALALAQVGEFSFVLFHAIKGTSLVPSTLESNLISAAILSMFITPFIISFGPRLAVGLGKFSRLKSLIKVDSAQDASETSCKLCDHVIIAGYGFAGKELSKSLDDNNISYIIVDINIENVKIATDEGRTAVFGDITNEDVLSQLEIERALEFVILINDARASEQAIRVAKKLVPNLFITVRTAYLLDAKSLIDIGADDVIVSEREAAVQVTSQLLERYQVEDKNISQQTSEIRQHLEDETSNN